jgi:hypothetical protein
MSYETFFLAGLGILWRVFIHHGTPLFAALQGQGVG